jgi:zinc protease
MKLTTFLLFPFLSLSLLIAEPAHPAFEHVQTLDGISEYRLKSNGLRVLLMPNEGLPVATVMVTYEVGSRNEVTGTTGATHILEHMMFKGTPKYNSTDGTLGDDYSTQMERIGARKNATTFYDRTNYYAVLPSEYVDLAIELEADRMRNLRILEEDLVSEMTVVRNEYERGENSPVRTLIKELYATAFVAQPYQHPVIGWRSDIENTSPAKLRKFYDTYYWPENAVVSIIGGFDPEATLSTIAEYYGVIPAAPEPIPTMDTLEPPQLGPRRFTIERNGQVGVVMVGYKVPEGSHEDWAALTLIQQILGADKTGRLYRALEDKGLASGTFSYAPQLRDPSLCILGVYLTPSATHEQAETILEEELAKLIADGVTEDELARAKSVINASTFYGRDGPFAIASEINEAIAMGDWSAYVKQPKEIQEVSIYQIQIIAKKYFLDQTKTTGWFVPTASQVASQTRISGEQYYRDPEIFEPALNQPLASVNSLSPSKDLVDFSSHTQSTQIGEIELITIDMQITGVVSFIGSFAAGDTLSPKDAPALASLTASMLDKGTTTLDRFAIAERLDTLGADLGFAASSHSMGFSGQFLRGDSTPVIGLLAEQLRHPAFESEVLETLKQRQLAGLLQAVDDPDYQAESNLSRLLYPESHPNYSTELDALIEDIKATTIEDIQKFYAEYYGPKSMRIVFAGDIDFPALTEAIRIAFANWSGGVDYPTEVPEQNTPLDETEHIQIADKTSVSVRYGYNTRLQRTDSDYLPFMIGNYILGGSFNSRLMTEVRKNRGLTYSIRSGHEGDILTPGNWMIDASFAPQLLEQGIAAIDEVVANWYQNGVTEDEVHKAIETLSGGYLVGLSTTGTVAGQVLSFMQRGFPADYIDTYPSVLREVTTNQVNQAIKQYLDPETFSKVYAGSINTVDE